MKRYLLTGSIGFCLTSLCVFATVAFAERWMYENLGITGAYLVWTVLFIGLGGAVLRPLVKDSIRAVKFYTIFATGFFLYAVGLTGAYFTLRGVVGEWVGSFVGSILLGLVFVVGFGTWRVALRLCTVLFILNSIGYFLGSALNASIGGQGGMLLWGVAYGLFLGAGLGMALYLVQNSIKEVI